jgi:AraC-like DNA-binding protein
MRSARGLADHEFQAVCPRREETLRGRPRPAAGSGARRLGISDIAARAGLTATWFSSAFKDRYGETPRAVRRRSGTGDVAERE